MKIIQAIKKIFGSIIYNENIIYEGVKILHITDTPTTGYNSIIKLIRKIKPNYIIHTGDLADNIKLEIYPEKIDLYKKRVQKFILALEAFDCEFYIVLGNHDNSDFIKKIMTSTHVIQVFRQISICNKRFLLTHKLEDVLNQKDLMESSDYILHGHSIYDEIPNMTPKVLNGLRDIYLIYPQTDKIYPIEYPIGTNDSRMQRFGTGI